MKAFNFRLAPILTMREGKRESALGAYAQSIQECNVIEKEVTELKNDLLTLQDDIAAQRKKSFLPHAELPNQSSILNFKNQISTKEHRLRKAREDKSLKRNQFLEADNALKSVIRLKEKQQSAHLENQLSKEERELNDIINSRFNFNSNLK